MIRQNNDVLFIPYPYIRIFNIVASLFFCLLVVLYVTGCSSSSSSSPSYTDTIKEGRAAVKEIMESTGASSVSLAFIDGNRVVWAETFGLADKESLTAPTVDTMYCIGSTSKMVAAVAVMKLVDQGLISLDGPLKNYLPSFSMASPEYSQITVRMLLNHSAGFPGTDYRNSETSAPLPFSLSAQILETLKTQRLKHAPGYMNVYSNDGFTIIEQLVAAVTGKSYAQFVQDEIFTPLGMHHSRYPLGYFPENIFAQRYSAGAHVPQLFLNSFGSGGLYSTPTDLAKIAMMILGGGRLGDVRILSEASVAAMGVDQTAGRFNPVKAKSYSYGLGWDTVIQPGLGAVGVTAWQKGGDVTLYGSVMTVVPSERMAVVVMGASEGFGSGNATVIAERILLRALAEKGRIVMPAPLSLSPRPVRAPSQALLDSVSGYYANYNTLMRVQKQPDNSMNIDTFSADNGWTPWKTGLRLRDDNRFYSDESPSLSYSFTAADNRRYLIIRYVTGYGHYQDEIVYGQQISAAGPLPATWNNRLGKVWLMTNAEPDSDVWESPSMRLNAFDDLLLLNRGGMQAVNPSFSSVTAGMMLLVPQVYGRDLDDIVIENHVDGEWARLGSFLYRPQETIPALGAGRNSVRIGSEGLAEWRIIDATGVSKTISIPPDTRWDMYNSNFERIGNKMVLSGDTYYLLFHDSTSVDVE
ncbi:MAG TPA: serine hydrolase domain-containing protein [Geobacteraceae bacterium]|nr:serine hydrolase domain-containing protein [Geobacteraceae bacterium]